MSFQQQISDIIFKLLTEYKLYFKVSNEINKLVKVLKF